MKNCTHGIFKLIAANLLKTAVTAVLILGFFLYMRFGSDPRYFLETMGILLVSVTAYSVITAFLLSRDIATPLEYFLTRLEKNASTSSHICSLKPSRRLYNTLCRIDSAFSKLLGDMKQASQDLVEANSELGRVYTTIEKSPIVVFEWSIEPGTPVNYVSDNIRKYGYDPIEFLNGSVDYWDILHPDDVSAAQNKVWSTRKEKNVLESRQTYRVICKDGTVKWVEELTYYERDHHGNEITEKGILSDVTEMKLAEAKITWLTYHDKLTSLYNRTWVEDRFATLDNEFKKPVTIMVGDMNGLKLINDLLGHKAGDELLKTMSNILRKATRGTGYEVARLGGDEFVIVLDGGTVSDAETLSRSITQLCSQKVSGSFTPSISWGFSGRLENERKLTDLIFKEADQHMYANKEQDSIITKTNVLRSIQESFRKDPYEGDGDSDVEKARKHRAVQRSDEKFDLLQFREQSREAEALNDEDRIKNLLEKRYDPNIVAAFLESLDKTEK